MPAASIEQYCLIAAGMRISAEMTVVDIESYSRRSDIEGWMDVTPMLDEQQHYSGLVADFRRHIDFAIAAQLVERHPNHPHLLRRIVAL